MILWRVEFRDKRPIWTADVWQAEKWGCHAARYQRVVLSPAEVCALLNGDCAEPKNAEFGAWRLGTFDYPLPLPYVNRFVDIVTTLTDGRR